MSLSRKVTIKIGDNSYEIAYPNIGQEIDIETRKVSLTNGAYHSMQKMKTVATARVLDAVDMISYFSVLIPSFEKDIRGIKSIMELDYSVLKPYIDAYAETFLPWYIEWQKLLNGIEKAKEEKDGE